MGFSIHVKHAGSDVEIDGLDDTTTVAALKERIEAATGVFARRQKLILKGKVLADGRQALAAAGLSGGARLMLLAAAASAGGPSAAAASAAKAGGGSAALAARLKVREALRSGGGGLNSSSSEQQQQQQQQQRGGGGDGAQLSLAERRAAWAKTGVVVLRDLGLDELPGGAVDATLGGARSADFSLNRLCTVPTAALGCLTGLASLRLSDNRLAADGLPWGALSALRGLTALAVDGNALERLPAALGGCAALVRLEAGRNRLASIEPGALGPLTALRELKLESNALTALPDDLGACTALEELDATGNALAALPAGMTALAALHTCRLDGNRIKALPDNLLSACASLATLQLRGNPITVAQLRETPGFAEYDARRRARADKRLGGRVMAAAGGATFCEGADVEQWEHHRR